MRPGFLPRRPEAAARRHWGRLAHLQVRDPQLGVHPSAWSGGGTEQSFDVSLCCDDLESTMAELTERGATFGDISDQQWGTTVPLTSLGPGRSCSTSPSTTCPP